MCALVTGGQTCALPIFTLYDTAPEELYRSFADGRVRFDEYSDSFGRFRSIYMPVTAADGRVHVIGADIDLARLDQRLHDALVQSIAIGIALLTLSMAIGWLLVSRLVPPLVGLTAHGHAQAREQVCRKVSVPGDA